MDKDKRMESMDDRLNMVNEIENPEMIVVRTADGGERNLSYDAARSMLSDESRAWLDEMGQYAEDASWSRQNMFDYLLRERPDLSLVDGAENQGVYKLGSLYPLTYNQVLDNLTRDEQRELSRMRMAYKGRLDTQRALDWLNLERLWADKLSELTKVRDKRLLDQSIIDSANKLNELRASHGHWQEIAGGDGLSRMQSMAIALLNGNPSDGGYEEALARTRQDLEDWYHVFRQSEEFAALPNEQRRASASAYTDLTTRLATAANVSADRSQLTLGEEAERAVWRTLIGNAGGLSSAIDMIDDLSGAIVGKDGGWYKDEIGKGAQAAIAENYAPSLASESLWSLPHIVSAATGGTTSIGMMLSTGVVGLPMMALSSGGNQYQEAKQSLAAKRPDLSETERTLLAATEGVAAGVTTYFVERLSEYLGLGLIPGVGGRGKAVFNPLVDGWKPVVKQVSVNALKGWGAEYAEEIIENNLHDLYKSYRGDSQQVNAARDEGFAGWAGWQWKLASDSAIGVVSSLFTGAVGGGRVGSSVEAAANPAILGGMGVSTPSSQLLTSMAVTSALNGNRREAQATLDVVEEIASGKLAIDNGDVQVLARSLGIPADNFVSEIKKDAKVSMRILRDVLSDGHLLGRRELLEYVYANPLGYNDTATITVRQLGAQWVVQLVHGGQLKGVALTQDEESALALQDILRTNWLQVDSGVLAELDDGLGGVVRAGKVRGKWHVFDSEGRRIRQLDDAEASEMERQAVAATGKLPPMRELSVEENVGVALSDKYRFNGRDLVIAPSGTGHDGRARWAVRGNQDDVAWIRKALNGICRLSGDAADCVYVEGENPREVIALASMREAVISSDKYNMAFSYMGRNKSREQDYWALLADSDESISWMREHGFDVRKHKDGVVYVFGDRVPARVRDMLAQQGVTLDVDNTMSRENLANYRALSDDIPGSGTAHADVVAFLRSLPTDKRRRALEFFSRAVPIDYMIRTSDASGVVEHRKIASRHEFVRDAINGGAKPEYLDGKYFIVFDSDHGRQVSDVAYAYAQWLLGEQSRPMPAPVESDGALAISQEQRAEQLTENDSATVSVTPENNGSAVIAEGQQMEQLTEAEPEAEPEAVTEANDTVAAQRDGITREDILSPSVDEINSRLDELKNKPVLSEAERREVSELKADLSELSDIQRGEVNSQEQEGDDDLSLGESIVDADEIEDAEETPAGEQENQEETPVVESAAAEQEVQEETPAAEEPVVEQEAQEEAPAVEQETQEKAPAVEQETQEKAPAVEQETQEKAPAVEQETQEKAPAVEPPAAEQEVQEETPAAEEPVVEQEAQEEAPAVEPEAQTAELESIPDDVARFWALSGNTYESYHPNGEKIPPGGFVAVVDAASPDVLFSGDKGYNRKFQPKIEGGNRNVQVSRIASDLRVPSLFGTSETDSGAPIMAWVDGHFQTIAGNGRGKGIREAYRTGKAEHYRRAVQNWAMERGIDVSSFVSPMFVRIMPDMSVESLMQHAIWSNQSRTLVKSKEEELGEDVTVLSLHMKDMIGLLRVGESGDVLSKGNSAFVQAFLNRFGVRNGDVNANGVYQPQVRRRIEKALLGVLFAELPADRRDSILSLLSDESQMSERGMLSVLKATFSSISMLLNISALNKNYSINYDLASALEALSGYRAIAPDRRMNMEDYLRQPPLVTMEDQLPELSLSGKMLFLLLGEAKSEVQVRKLYRSYAMQAAEAITPGMTLFDFGTHTKEEILRDILLSKELAKESLARWFGKQEKQPANQEEAPVNQEEAPVNQEEAPVNQEEAPVNQEEAPANQEGEQVATNEQATRIVSTPSDVVSRIDGLDAEKSKPSMAENVNARTAALLAKPWLSEQEIRESGADPEAIAAAIEYIGGDSGVIAQAGYITVKMAIESRPPAVVADEPKFILELQDILFSDDAMAVKTKKLKSLADAHGKDLKSVQERMEGVIVDALSAINNDKISSKAKYDLIVELYGKQPILGERTGASAMHQAYSTPAPLAFALGKRIGIESANHIYEPTAGNGMLVAIADRSKVHVNELQKHRVEELRRQGYATVTDEDAKDYSPSQISDCMIMNPPFGNSRSYISVQGLQLSKLDHQIAYQALQSLSADGRVGIIIGANTDGGIVNLGTGEATNTDMRFMEYLYNNYNVVDNFIVDGSLYSKQGASYPVRVITLNGRKAAPEEIDRLAPREVEKLDTWEQVWERLNGELERVEADDEAQKPGPVDTRPIIKPSIPSKSRVRRKKSSKANPESAQSPSNQAVSSSTVTNDTAVTADGVPIIQESPRSGLMASIDEFRSVFADAGSSYRNRMNISLIGLDPEQIAFVSRVIFAGVKLGFELVKAGAHEFSVWAGRMNGIISDLMRSRGFTFQDIEEYLVEVWNHAVEYASERLPISKWADRFASVKAAEDVAPTHEVVEGASNGPFTKWYNPASNGEGLKSLTPAPLATATAATLNKLQEEVGNVDVFVRDQLGYSSFAELYDSLSAEQIDGVALAIRSFRHGYGFIIGDQTGMGKGRQCAAVMRWALRNDYLPVFFTEKANLFTDMYRDGNDIGQEFRPLMIANQSNSTIKESDGRVIWQGLKQDVQFSELRRFINGEDTQYNVIFTNYSQVSDLGNTQQKMFEELFSSRRCLLVLDEAHNASGDSTTGIWFRGGELQLSKARQKETGSRNIMLPGVLRNPEMRVMYTSATFAKRPNNMPLYFRTSLGDAVENIDSLPELVAYGGVPLQQWLSRALAEDGQFIRRESDFTGVEFRNICDATETYDELVEQHDMLVDCFKDMVTLSNLIKDKVAQNKEMRHNNAEEQTLQSYSFASNVHNYLSQMLLGLKLPLTLERARHNFSENRKVVIGLTSTMESALDTYARDMGLKNGDVVDMSMKDILLRVLERMLVLTDTVTGRREIFNFDEHPDLRRLYNYLRRRIAAMQLSIPVSPIDYLRNELSNSGMKVAELTARNLGVDYSGDRPVLYTREQREKNINANVNAFNAGDVDVLIINAAGATGLSIHASRKFTDKRQRCMLMIQPSLNIALVLQMLGRINRQGQVELPIYEFLSTPLTAERRPNMILSRKMISLNANTKSDTKSEIDLGVDFLNEYGDYVANEYLKDHPSLETELNVQHVEPRDTTDGEQLTVAPVGKMAKLVSSLGLLHNDVQERIYSELTQNYLEYVEYKKSIGEYSLEIAAYDNWNARLQESHVVVAPSDANGSGFALGVEQRRYQVDERRKIPSWESVAARITRNFQLDSVDAPFEAAQNYVKEMLAPAHDAVSNVVNELRSSAAMRGVEFNEELALRRVNDMNAVLNDFLQEFRRQYGRSLSVKTQENEYFATLTGVKVKLGGDTSPVAPGRFTFEYAIADSVGRITVPYSQLRSGLFNVEAATIARESVFTGEDSAIVESRYVLTGNLIQACELSGKVGRIVSFTTSEGENEVGLLMPRAWRPKDLAKDPARRLKTVDDAISYLFDMGTNVRYKEVRSGDGTTNVTLMKLPNSYDLAIVTTSRDTRSSGDMIAVMGDSTRLVGKSYKFTKRGLREQEARTKLAAALAIVQRQGDGLNMPPEDASQVAFRTGNTDSVLGLDKQREVVDRLEKTYGVQVNLVQDEGLLPEGVLTQLDNHRSHGRLVGSGWKGMMSNGVIYINANNVSSEADLAASYIHEVAVHHGLRAALRDGVSYAQFLDEMEAMPDFARRTQPYLEQGLPRPIAIEEVIADIAEEYESSPLWKQLFIRFSDAFKRVLGKVGLTFDMSEAEARRVFLQSKYRLMELARFANGVQRASLREQLAGWWHKLSDVSKMYLSWGDYRGGVIPEINQMLRKAQWTLASRNQVYLAMAKEEERAVNALRNESWLPDVLNAIGLLWNGEIESENVMEEIPHLSDPRVKELLAVKLRQRDLIDNLSTSASAVEGLSKSLRKAIMENIGRYHTRSYEIHRDPSWTPSNVVRHAAANQILGELRDMIAVQEALIVEGAEKLSESFEVHYAELQAGIDAAIQRRDAMIQEREKVKAERLAAFDEEISQLDAQLREEWLDPATARVLTRKKDRREQARERYQQRFDERTVDKTKRYEAIIEGKIRNRERWLSSSVPADLYLYLATRSESVIEDRPAVFRRRAKAYARMLDRLNDHINDALDVEADLASETPALSLSAEDVDLLRTANGIVERILQRNSGDGQTFAGNMGASYRILQGSFIRRKNLPVPIRQLLGEITDVARQFAITSSRLSRIVVMNKLMNDIYSSQNALDVQDPSRVIYTNAFQKDNGDVYNMQLEGRQYGKLRGMYTDQATKRMLDGYNVPRGWAMRMYQRFVGLSRYAKTVGNIPTHLRNFLGNIAFAMSDGEFMRLPAYSRAMTRAYHTLTGNDESSAAERRRLIGLGLIGSGAHSQELSDVAKMAGLSVDDFHMGAFFFQDKLVKFMGDVKRMGRKVLRGMEWAYAFEDNIFRLAAYYAKTSRGISDDDAIRRVRDVYPTYDMAPVFFLEYARNNPFIRDFIVFKAEALRCYVNAYKYSVKDLKHGDFSAASGLALTTLLATQGAQMLIGYMASVIAGALSDEEEPEPSMLTADEVYAMRRLMPDYQADNALIPWKTGDKRISYIDMGYIYPHDYLVSLSPDMQYIMGPRNMASLPRRIFWDNLVGSMGLDMFASLYANRDPRTGRRIYDDTFDLAAFLGKQVLPTSAIYAGQAAKLALSDEGEYLTGNGEVVSAASEASKVVTPVRVRSLDVSTAYRIKLSRLNNQMRELQGRANAAWRRHYDGSALRSDAEAAEKKALEAFSGDLGREILEMDRAASVFLDSQQRMQILKDAGFSERQRRLILSGRTIQYRRPLRPRK